MVGRPRRTWLVAETGVSLSAARAIEARCEQAGFRSYFPQCRFTKITRGRARRRIAPLFPGYVFARCGARQLLDIKGVSGVVRIGEMFCRLLDSDIRDLQTRELAGEFGAVKMFSRNQKVRVLGSGPFAGQLADYADMDDDLRHEAMVELLGRRVPARFRYDELEDVAA